MVNRRLQPTRDDVRVAWLAALAITIHIVESALPSPFPGFKPGLANVITITALLWFGWRTAAWVSLLRVVAGSIIVGTFLSPTFALSLSGALASLGLLGIAILLARQALGPIGYSVLASMAHIGGQFMVARWLFIPHDGLFRLFPILMTAALIFGIVSGVVAQKVVKGIKTG